MSASSTAGGRSGSLRTAAAAIALLVGTSLALTGSASGQDPQRTVDELQWQTDCVIEWVEPHACPVGDQRERVRNEVDAAADPVASPASAAVEGGVRAPRACADDIRQGSRSYAIACAGGGGGESGRTYYKGNGPPNYECEYQAEWVRSTNHRYPKGVYNSMRVCRPGMSTLIACWTRDEYGDRACYEEGWRNPGELISVSFSPRYREFWCRNQGTPGHVRCAYDWVR